MGTLRRTLVDRGASTRHTDTASRSGIKRARERRPPQPVPRPLRGDLRWTNGETLPANQEVYCTAEIARPINGARSLLPLPLGALVKRRIHVHQIERYFGANLAPVHTLDVEPFAAVQLEVPRREAGRAEEDAPAGLERRAEGANRRGEFAGLGGRGWRSCRGRRVDRVWEPCATCRRECAVEDGRTGRETYSPGGP